MRTKKLHNKGFSLIETVSILVILSIIALIAIPNILRVITKTKMNGIEDTTKLLAKAAQDYWIEKQLEHIEISKVDLTDETLDYDGKKPKLGYAYFDEHGHAYIKMYYEDYCVTREYDETIKYEKTSLSECNITSFVTLTFNTNGGNGSIVSKQYNIDSMIGDLPKATRYGYNFVGWYTASNVEINNDTVISENMTVYAKWENKIVNVVLEVNEGTIIDYGDYTQNVEGITGNRNYDESYGKLPDIKRDGYNFLGWVTTTGKIISSNSIVTNEENHTLYAQWSINSYLVSLDANGGDILITDIIVQYNQLYGELPTPTRPGYTFAGWYVDRTFVTAITKETVMNFASNHSIYARWTANTYTVIFERNEYKNGEEVYFNPVTAQVCDASEVVSTPGYKDGCMKWYAFLDDGGTTIKLLLDHNITAAVAWNDDEEGITPTTALEQLNSDVSNWDSTIKSTARLISANEVNQIAPTNSNFNWNINEISTSYFFYSGNKKEYRGAAGTNTFAWLFSNLDDCETWGCNINANESEGYWTSTYAVSTKVWAVGLVGSLDTYNILGNDFLFGIRPVIEINKSLLKEVKEVMFDNTYNSLPTLNRIGYTFNGWYTTGGVNITNNSIVSIPNNHILYPQWSANTYTITLNRTEFKNGEAVYFNPVTARVCNAEDAVSTTGTKDGCMKWYAFLDDGYSKVKLLLDHNTTAKVAWNADSTGTTPVTALAQLNADVTNWNNTIKSTARLISASEVHQIAPSLNNNWNVNDWTTWYYFYTGNQTSYTGAAGSNTYAWLFDNTSNCTSYGCNVDDSSTNGYWTSNYTDSGQAWGVSRTSGLGVGNVTVTNDIGIRPVIEIDKSLLASTKEVVYDSTYGTLPTIESQNYDFLGWFTNENAPITYATKVNIITNINLYSKSGLKDGEEVYFNPTTGMRCTPSESVSTTGTKNGCMKWYSFLDTGSSKVKLLLDHDLSQKIAWNEEGGETPVTVSAQLALDTEGWKQTINGTSSKITIRLISAQEVNQIAPTAEDFTWDINRWETSYYLHNGNKTAYKGEAGSNKYAWLFDNTYGCETSGCNITDSGTYGYWTSTYAGSEGAWHVYCLGDLRAGPVTHVISIGVRPVIEIDRTIIE